MPSAHVDEIVTEINSLLDQQLAFLKSDLRHADLAACREYDYRYSQIRTLCEALAETPEEDSNPLPLASNH